MPGGKAELHEEWRLVGPHPGVDDLGALDGGDLPPAVVRVGNTVGGRRHHLDAVLVGRQVLDGDLAVFVGETDASGAWDVIPHTVVVAAERIAKVVLDDVASTVHQGDGKALETGLVDVKGIVQRSAVAVVEHLDGDLCGLDGVGAHVDGHVLVVVDDRYGRSAHVVGGSTIASIPEWQHRNEIAPRWGGDHGRA